MKIREFDENSLIDYYSKNVIDFLGLTNQVNTNLGGGV